MIFPVHIMAETKKSGIRADIYHFEQSASRIHSENILLCHLKGDLKITFNLRSFKVLPCSLLFVPSGQSILFESSDAYVLIFYLSDAVLENRQFQIQLDSHDAPTELIYQPLLSTICQFLNPKIHQLAFQDIWQQKLCQDLLYQLLSGFCFPDTFHQSKPADKEIPADFAELLKFIDFNYMKNIQLKQLADAFYYTPSHLSKLFLRYTGQLFSDYLTGLRLSKALPLLLQTSMDISQISDQCGFSNARAFGQVFQKHYHTRPSVYRKLYYENSLNDFSLITEADWQNLSESGIFDTFNKICNRTFTETTKNSINTAQDTLFTIAQAPSSVLHRHLGQISLKNSTKTTIAQKNNILNIDFCRDLLMEDLQIQIRQLLKDFNYEYITLDCFLADDLQIYFSDNLNADFTIKERGRRRITYDFTLYDQIFHFIETTGLKPIIPLTYIPSFLAVNSDHYDPVFHSCKCMPFSMTEWQAYIHALFTHLNQKFSSVLSQARVFLWKIPDVVISHQTNMTEDDYFSLYLCTYQAIHDAMPSIAIDSPTISCTASGFSFMKHFLNYCSNNNCLPEQLLFTYYYAENNHFHFTSSFLNCTNFVNTVQSYLRSHFPKKIFNFCMLDYNFVFGCTNFVDGLPGAMLPIIFTLNQSEAFVSLGMEKALDYTTRIYFGKSQFSGLLSAVTSAGGKKAAYYSLKFLQSLGSELILNKPGCCLTKTENKIIMLLYYNIPQNEWKRDYTSDTLELFYKDFTDMDFSMTMTDVPFEHMLLQEQYLTPDYGSAYETWVKNGWPVITDTNGTSVDEPIYTSFPVISTTKITAKNDYTYSCQLKPFEIRLVELIKID